MTSLPKIGKDDLSVFPNPAADFIKIKGFTDGDTEIIVTDMLGKTVFRTAYSMTKGSFHEINTAQLKPGAYILNLWTDKQRGSVQLFIE
jgi:hypothetical protein